MDAWSLRDPQSKLREWLKANTKSTGANHLQYDEFPRLFTWVRRAILWMARAKFRRRGTRGEEPFSAGAAVPSV